MDIPSEMDRAARERADATREQRKGVLELLLHRRRGSVPEEREKLLHLIERHAQLERPLAEAVLDGREVSANDVTPEQAEVIRALRELDDFLPLNFVDRARRASRAVGRFVTADGEGSGTCFMISPDLLITNNHVLPDTVLAERLKVEFDFEAEGQPRPVQLDLDPRRFFLTDKELDWTVVALPGQTGGDAPPHRDFCPLAEADNMHQLGFYVNIIQHPRNSPKTVVIRENWLVLRDEVRLYYTADIDKGSSGAPVFNDHWEVVGLHHWAGTTGPLDLFPGLKIEDIVNEGIRADAIAAALAARRDKLSEEQQELLDAAIPAPLVPAGG